MDIQEQPFFFYKDPFSSVRAKPHRKKTVGHKGKEILYHVQTFFHQGVQTDGLSVITPKKTCFQKISNQQKLALLWLNQNSTEPGFNGCFG